MMSHAKTWGGHRVLVFLYAWSFLLLDESTSLDGVDGVKLPPGTIQILSNTQNYW